MEVDPVHKIAVKVLKPALSNNKFFQEQLIREGQAAQKLQSPNIRKVFEIVEDEVDHSIQLVMEYIDGYNLEQYIQNFGNIPENQIIRWCKQILPTLAEAHRLGIVHGLLSPKNLLITPRGDLKITDFKGALFESELFPEDEDSEDILYLSPEQIQHVGKVGAATDIYTFGVTLYSLLTGKDPYNVSNSGIDEIRIRILNDPLPFIDSYSFHINEIIQIATAKNQVDRYPDFDSMLEAITGEKRVSFTQENRQTSLFEPTETESEEKQITNTTKETEVETSERKTEKEAKKQDKNEEHPSIGEAKRDHTQVVTHLNPQPEINPDDEDEVDQDELDARARAIWEKIEAVRHEKPDPKVDKVEIVSTSNIDASQLGKKQMDSEKSKSVAAETSTDVTKSEKENLSSDIKKAEQNTTKTATQTKTQSQEFVNQQQNPVDESKSTIVVPTIVKPVEEKKKTVEEVRPDSKTNTKQNQQESKKEKEEKEKKPGKSIASDLSSNLPAQTDATVQDQSKESLDITDDGSGRARYRWIWPLMVIVICAGAAYWWMHRSDKPQIVEEVPVVSEPVADSAPVGKTDSAVSSGAVMNFDSLSVTDTSITSLEELAKLRQEHDKQVAILKAKREAERKRKEEEAKKSMVNTSEVEVIGKFNSGIAPFRWKGKVGFINDANKVVITPKYDDILTFSDGMAPVRLNGQWGFVNTAGKEIAKTQYEEIFGFSKGLAGVKKNGKWGFINTSGKVATPLKYDLVTDYSEGMAGVRKDGKWGFVNLSGKEIIPCKYHNAWSFTDGLAGVENNGEWGFVNKSGKIVVPLDYSQVSNFSFGLACVVKNGRYGYIDDSGKVIIPFVYESAKPFNGSTARVFANGKWIYINKSGKCVRNCN
jgi:serine/threonine protein kinase